MSDARRKQERQMWRTRAILELANETIDQEVDLDALHDALAALLVRYHKARSLSEPTAG